MAPRNLSPLLLLFLICNIFASCSISYAFPIQTKDATRAYSAITARTGVALNLAVEPPRGGFAVDDGENDGNDGPAGVLPPPSISSSTMERVGINSRGAKMNEIDFTLAPSDVSLSKCYQMSITNNAKDVAKVTAPSTDASVSSQSLQEQQQERVQTLSLTRALNTASNRAVRRILLARSWPSAEALNLSLRTVLMQQQQKQEKTEEEGSVQQQNENKEESDSAKCPVPRPILNILVNRRADDTKEETNPAPRSTGDKEQDWINNQIAVFRESYGSVPRYDLAEAYLVCILNLATSGKESVRVHEIMGGGIYEESYRRILSVIQSVGAVLEGVPESKIVINGKEIFPRKQIAPKLLDKDICLSMLDKIALSNERKQKENEALASGNETVENVFVPYDAAALLAYDSDPSNKAVAFEEFKKEYEMEAIALVTAKKKSRDQMQLSIAEEKKPTETSVESKPKGAYEKGRLRRLMFWKKSKADPKEEKSDSKDEISSTDMNITAENSDVSDDETSLSPQDNTVIKPNDLGGVLLSAEEPTMTRQLNVLSNIVQRTLIFGGDQELLVLAETLDADKPAFIQRWYKNDSGEVTDIRAETRPGVMYLNSIIQLLRDCYTKGVIYDVTPTLPLTTGYRNAYGRLTASLIELGSGYVRPSPSSALSLAMTSTAATAKYLTSTAPPKSALEELGRFAKWESAVRKNRENPYPEDLVGTWNVEDVVGGSIIGTTQVTFRPEGELTVKAPMQGLRWRLDAGPTHLDTCTFQVLSDDGAILQYKGFVDRGSRLEARVSKRSVTMRGSVSFLMREAESGIGGSLGSDSYWDDMMPMNYKNGMTKFVMTRIVNGNDAGSSTFKTRNTEIVQL